MLLPMAGGGVVVACLMGLMSREAPSRTTDEVREEIQSILLTRTSHAGLDDGGSIGPWWMAAERLDQTAGEFINIRLNSADLRLGARSAKLRINAEDDTFSFELNDVVMIRVPADGSESTEGFGNLKFYMLGPVEYGVDIIATDAGVGGSHDGFGSLRTHTDTDGTG